jgi:hypothetical protein
MMKHLNQTVLLERVPLGEGGFRGIGYNIYLTKVVKPYNDK